MPNPPSFPPERGTTLPLLLISAQSGIPCAVVSLVSLLVIPAKAGIHFALARHCGESRNPVPLVLACFFARHSSESWNPVPCSGSCRLPVRAKRCNRKKRERRTGFQLSLE